MGFREFNSESNAILWKCSKLHVKISKKMPLIISISGIRGTIGGKSGENLTPVEIIQFVSAFSKWLQTKNYGKRCKVAIGRDARISGNLISQLIINTLTACGVDVIDLGLATTPTVEMAVPHFQADGGIIITASHNPMEWNALKLLNAQGEFISADDGNQLMEIIRGQQFEYATVENLGKIENFDFTPKHIDLILNLPLVKTEAIRQSKFKAVVDGINSVGALAVPKLLESLGVEVVLLNGEPNGRFAHNPEPLEQHLTETMKAVVSHKANIGIVVDPDVDRLAIIDEKGRMVSEEYTIVFAADYVLRHTPGNTVSNLSSSRALRDITRQFGQTYAAAAVGEVNVVAKMKETQAVIGGEGNGGVIYPALHYGRDALVGIALILSYMAETAKSVSVLKDKYPKYFIQKSKIELKESVDFHALCQKLREAFPSAEINTIDGIKLDFDFGWIHLRKSNTEPIIRIYSEAITEDLLLKMENQIRNLLEQ